MKAILTQIVKRPKTLNQRKVSFVQWLAKINNNHYCNNIRVEEGLNRIL